MLDLLKNYLKNFQMTNIKYFKSFKKSFKKLNRNNKNLIEDIIKLVEILEKKPTTGVYLGCDIYKVRIANSSKKIGKRWGFRVITYYIDKNSILYLVEIYEKNSIENISINKIINLIEKEIR